MRKHNEPSLEAERDALREEVARLNQEIRRRQMELDILKKAEEIIKKDPGLGPGLCMSRGGLSAEADPAGRAAGARWPRRRASHGQ